MPRRTSEPKGTRWGTDLSPVNSSPVAPTECDVRELIAIRAYELYLQRETTGGDEVTDWLTAEGEVMSCLQTNPMYGQPRVPRSVNGAKRAAAKPAAVSRARKSMTSTSSRKNGSTSEAA